MKKLNFLVTAILVIISVMVFGSLDVTASAAVAGISSATFLGPVMYRKQIFEEVQRAYPKFTVAPGFLRTDVSLTNSANRYSFDIKKNGNESLVERKLDRNDVFITTNLGLYLAAQVSTTLGAEELCTYPNPITFATASGFTPAHLNAIYSGWLELKVAMNQLIEALPTSLFKYVPTSQKQTANNYINFTEFGVEDMSYWLGAKLTLKGTDDIQFNVQFPSFSGMQIAAVAANTTNKLVLINYGFLIKNAANQ